MTVENRVIGAIEEQAWIDGVADPAQAAVRGALSRVPAVEDALHGHFLGHPLHPMLILLPVGAWAVGAALDLTELSTGTRRYRRAADLLAAVGFGGALVAAVAGIADWSRTTGATKRVGFVHGALNQVVAGLYGLSLLSRSKGARGTGIALSLTGCSGVLAGAWLGGELAYRFGVGVGVRPEAPPPPVFHGEKHNGVAAS